MMMNEVTHCINSILRSKSDREIFSVPFSSNLQLEDLRQRFKQLVRTVHPDKCDHPQASEAFRKVYSAYETLNAGIGSLLNTQKVHATKSPGPKPFENTEIKKHKSLKQFMREWEEAERFRFRFILFLVQLIK